MRVDIMEQLETQTLLLQHLKLDRASATEDMIGDCDRVAEQLG